MNPLKGLEATARPLLDEHFRSGETETVNVFDHEVKLALGREIDVEPLITVIDEAMRKFRSNPDSSDAWMAPRVHAALRLVRREAADKRIWNYLNVAVKPDYVRWRFKADKESGVAAPLDRFVGEDSKNAIGRLWWAAELTRNGNAYTETQNILRSVRFSTSWQALDAMHHRPATIAIARFWREFNDGKGLTDWQSQRLAKAFNLRLTTLSLDALAPNPAVDTIAIREWCAEPVDETKYLDELPIGPDEEPVPESSIQAVYDVLVTLAKEINLADMRGPSRRKAEGTAPEGTEEEVATD